MAPNENPIQSARKIFLGTIPSGPSSVEILPLLRARGRRLSADLSAVIDDPPYSRSIMEGYVVCVSDLESASNMNPVTLEVVGGIPVGQGDASGLEEGKVLEVTTGSFIPSGNYGVVRKWNVVRKGGQITATQTLKKGEDIETQGELRQKGKPLLKKGISLSSDDLSLLASQGIVKVEVARRPRIALFSSGNEVIPAASHFKIGSIWDCNEYGLSSLIEEAGGLCLFQGIVADDFELFTKKLKEALSTADMIVISGGTGVGGRNFTVDLLNAVGPPGVLVNGIPMRSGKPIILGAAGEKPILCVAGHPPEAARGFELFGKPMIGHLMGDANENMA